MLPHYAASGRCVTLHRPLVGYSVVTEHMRHKESDVRYVISVINVKSQEKNLQPLHSGPYKAYKSLCELSLRRLTM